MGRNGKWMEEQRVIKSKQLKDFVESIGHKMISEYKNNYEKIEFECPHGHRFLMRSNNIKRGQRCPKCANHCPEQSKEKLIKLVNESGYKLLTDYVADKKKVKFLCDNNHEFSMLPQAFKRGCRCPKCGINAGYDREKQGIFYLVRWTHPVTKHSFLKYGITNRVDYLKRIIEQAKKTEYEPEELSVRYFFDGSIPPKIESIIKSVLTTGIIDRTLFASGFTETVEDKQSNIDYIIELIKAA